MEERQSSKLGFGEWIGSRNFPVVGLLDKAAKADGKSDDLLLVSH